MTKTRKTFTRFLVTLVSALGLCSTTLLLTDPPAESSDNSANSVFSMNSTAMENRGLASVANDDKSIASAVPTETLFDIRCDTDAQTQETSNNRFRLKGKACVGHDETNVTTQIQNKSNGYVATVFHRTPQIFTTDYINLNEGSNEIAVKFETETGTIDKTITVVRTTKK